MGPDHLEKGELWCYICWEVVISSLSIFQGTAASCDLNSLSQMTGSKNKSLKYGTLHIIKAARYHSPCYRQVRYVSYIIGHKRIFSIQVELKGDGGCLIMGGPTVHNKRVRTGTQLASNKLSQAAEG